MGLPSGAECSPLLRIQFAYGLKRARNQNVRQGRYAQGLHPPGEGIPGESGLAEAARGAGAHGSTLPVPWCMRMPSGRGTVGWRQLGCMRTSRGACPALFVCIASVRMGLITSRMPTFMRPCTCRQQPTTLPTARRPACTQRVRGAWRGQGHRACLPCDKRSWEALCLAPWDDATQAACKHRETEVDSGLHWGLGSRGHVVVPRDPGCGRQICFHSTDLLPVVA